MWKTSWKKGVIVAALAQALIGTSVWAQTDGDAPPFAPAQTIAPVPPVAPVPPGLNGVAGKAVDAAARTVDAVQRRLDTLERQLLAEQSMRQALQASGADGTNEKVAEAQRQIAQAEDRIKSTEDELNKLTNSQAKVTFLGLATTQVSPELSDQLKLPAGFGLIVQTVTAGMAADTAGIKKYDILTKLDDQQLIAPVQLETLIRSHQPGDEVKITLIHEGATSVVTAKLTSSVGAKRLAAAKPVQVRLMYAPGNNQPAVVTGSVVTLNDGRHTLTLDGNQHLHVEDAGNGSVLFDGPVATDQDQAAVPKDLNPTLKKLFGEQKALNIQTAGTGSFGLTTDGNGTIILKPAADSAQTIAHQRMVFWSNKSHTLVLTLAANQPDHLLATDADGRVLFDGPVRTTQEQDVIPADVHDGFDFLCQHPDAGHDLLK
jgi:hypothetical protein